MTASVSASRLPVVEPRSNQPRGGQKGGDVFALAMEKAAANAGSRNQRVPAEPAQAAGGDALARHLGLLGQGTLHFARDEAGIAGQALESRADPLRAADAPASRQQGHLAMGLADKTAVKPALGTVIAPRTDATATAVRSDATEKSVGGDAAESGDAASVDDKPAPREPWQDAVDSAIQFLRAEPTVPVNRPGDASGAGATPEREPGAADGGEAETSAAQSSNRPAEVSPLAVTADKPGAGKVTDGVPQTQHSQSTEPAPERVTKPRPSSPAGADQADARPQDGPRAGSQHAPSNAAGDDAVSNAKASASTTPPPAAAIQPRDQAAAKPRPETAAGAAATARDAAVIAQAGATVSVATAPTHPQRPTRSEPAVEKNALAGSRPGEEPAAAPQANRPAKDDAVDTFEPVSPQADGEEPDHAHTGNRPAADATSSGATTAASTQPAPPTPLAGPSATVLAGIRAEPTWAAYFRSAQQSSPGEVTSLKIHLAPAQLGNVIALLKVEDESVSVELTAETVEAQQRLTADADTIVRSLRAIGIEVDRVTVQVATPTDATRGEAGAEQRREGSLADGQAGDARERPGGSRGEQQGYGGESPRGGADSSRQTERSGSARYI